MQYAKFWTLASLLSVVAGQTPQGFNPGTNVNLNVTFANNVVVTPGIPLPKDGKVPVCINNISFAFSFLYQPPPITCLPKLIPSTFHSNRLIPYNRSTRRQQFRNLYHLHDRHGRAHQHHPNRAHSTPALVATQQHPLVQRQPGRQLFLVLVTSGRPLYPTQPTRRKRSTSLCSDRLHPTTQLVDSVTV